MDNAAKEEVKTSGKPKKSLGTRDPPAATAILGGTRHEATEEGGRRPGAEKPRGG